jgi:hypothetical protein
LICIIFLSLSSIDNASNEGESSSTGSTTTVAPSDAGAASQATTNNTSDLKQSDAIGSSDETKAEKKKYVRKAQPKKSGNGEDSENSSHVSILHEVAPDTTSGYVF